MKHDRFIQGHPLVSFLYFVMVILMGTVIRHPAYVAASCVAGAVYYALLRGRALFRLLLGLLPLAILVTLLNPLFNPRGATVLFVLFGRNVTMEALLYGAVTAGIFLLTFLWFGCYSYVMTTEKFISLFSGVIPSISLLLVMVLRMIPELGRKLRHIISARSGIGKGTGREESMSHRLGHGLKSLSILTDRALEGSVVTADSMTARGYGCGKRSSFYENKWRRSDLMTLSMMILLLGLSLWLGKTDVKFIPKLRIPYLGWGFGAYCLLLCLPIFMYGKEALRWRKLRSEI
ncbi:MAG: hypothetical protein IKT58_02795 [Oscillospiraceae bacterium]|nr:hypothetical protein [Oscillospiraceae bacterium]